MEGDRAKGWQTRQGEPVDPSLHGLQTLLSTNAGLRAVCEGAFWRENLMTTCFNRCPLILTGEQTFLIYDSYSRIQRARNGGQHDQL